MSIIEVKKSVAIANLKSSLEVILKTSLPINNNELKDCLLSLRLLGLEMCQLNSKKEVLIGKAHNILKDSTSYEGSIVIEVDVLRKMISGIDCSREIKHYAVILGSEYPKNPEYYKSFLLEKLIESVTEPVEPVEPVTEPVEPVESVTEPVESVTEPVEPVEPVESVTEPVESVTEPVESVTEPVEPVESVTEPVEPIKFCEEEIKEEILKVLKSQDLEDIKTLALVLGANEATNVYDHTLFLMKKIVTEKDCDRFIATLREGTNSAIKEIAIQQGCCLPGLHIDQYRQYLTELSLHEPTLKSADNETIAIAPTGSYRININTPNTVNIVNDPTPTVEPDPVLAMINQKVSQATTDIDKKETKKRSLKKDKDKYQTVEPLSTVKPVTSGSQIGIIVQLLMKGATLSEFEQATLPNGDNANIGTSRNGTRTFFANYLRDTKGYGTRLEIDPSDPDNIDKFKFYLLLPEGIDRPTINPVGTTSAVSRKKAEKTDKPTNQATQEKIISLEQQNKESSDRVNDLERQLAEMKALIESMKNQPITETQPVKATKKPSKTTV